MNFPSDKFELKLAEPEDAKEIQELFEQGEFDGQIAVQYLRSPNPIASFEKEGEKAYLLILKDKERNKAVGLGGCIIRRVISEGTIKRLGYLTGLKLLPDYRKKFLFIPFIYQQLYSLTRSEVDLYITTILKDNIEVQRMLEKPRKMMPLYEYLGDYRVYFCKAGGHRLLQGLSKGPGRNKKYAARRITGEEMERFYTNCSGKTELNLERLDAYDLKNAVYYGLFEEGTIVACGYILNQQSYKQYVVKKYGGIYKLISKLPTRLFGYPSFPAVNEAANCACAGVFAENNASELIHKLWQYMRKDAVEFDFIMIGLYDKDPLRSYFDRTRHICYDSRCYIVDFEHRKTEYEKRIMQNIYLDVAFL